jgi:hypothetical protein
VIVADVISRLMALPADASVVAIYDCGCAEGDVTAVRVEGASVALMVDNSEDERADRADSPRIGSGSALPRLDGRPHTP